MNSASTFWKSVKNTMLYLVLGIVTFVMCFPLIWRFRLR